MTIEKRHQALRGPDRIETHKRGIWLLKNPATNKGLAFTAKEREVCGLSGLLPAASQTIEEQVQLELEHLREKSSDLERYIGIAGLLYRNEVLFYRLLVDHIMELVPIVYTPTVGEACRRFSHIVRDMRGIWLTPDDLHRMPERLRNYPYQDIRLIVVTDNERILGLGDQGAGGMGIPVGKLALYVAGAGIHPSKVLPISLDVGTNNEELLNDPLYIGHRAHRLTGKAYDEFIEAFVEAVSDVFPHALLQWEDFHKRNAFRLLEGYRHRITCFNDDIQGTAGVAVAGIMSALRITGGSLREQRVLFMGAGEACTGIADLLAAAMRSEGASDEEIAASRLAFDSRGLLREGAEGPEEHKRRLSTSPAVLERLGLGGLEHPTPEQVIAALKPTVLVGATAMPGTFTREMVEEMSRHVERPIVMPMSNPTSKAECTPADAIAWSEGRALIATGSPFEDVEYEGRRHVIGQSNNMFVFPGVGLGAIVSEIREVDEEIFLIAARALAECVTPERLALGALYPEQSQLRTVSARVASAIIRHASRENLGAYIPDEEVDRVVDMVRWFPEYAPVVPSPRG